MHCIILLKRLGEKLVQTCRANLKSHFRFLQNEASLPLNKGQAWEKKQNDTYQKPRMSVTPTESCAEVIVNVYGNAQRPVDVWMSFINMLCTWFAAVWGERNPVCSLFLRFASLFHLRDESAWFVLCPLRFTPRQSWKVPLSHDVKGGAVQCLAVRILQTSAKQSSWRQILRTRLTVCWSSRTQSHSAGLQTAWDSEEYVETSIPITSEVTSAVSWVWNESRHFCPNAYN